MKKNKNLPDFYTALCDKYHSHPVVLEKTLENPLDCKEIQPVKPKGNQSWIFTGLMLKLKLQYLGHLMQRTDLLEKTLNAAKDWRREENWMTEYEMVGWHHLLDRHEFEQALGVDDGQGSLACCSPRGHKESGVTKQLNWTFIYTLSGSQVNYICRSSDGHTIFNHNVKKEKKTQCPREKYSGHRFPWGILSYEFLIDCILKKE